MSRTTSNETASQAAYTELDIALSLVNRLTRHISERRLDAMSGKANWGHHGDAQHINEQLMNILVCIEAGTEWDEEETKERIREEIGA